MYVASMDIKTANISGDQNVHGWITAAISRDNARRGGSGGLRKCGRCRSFHEAHPPRERRGSLALAQNGNADLMEW